MSDLRAIDARKTRPLIGAGVDWASIADRTGLAVFVLVGIVAAVSMLRAGIAFDLVWRTGQADHYYGAVWAADIDSRYVYPPTLAQLAGALGFLTYPMFAVAWSVLLFVGMWGSTRWWSLPVLLVSGAAAFLWGTGHALADPLVYPLIGNIQPLIAWAIVMSFRYPAAWAFVILTKIGPGIGVLWFAIRREWRAFGIAIGATAAIAAVSFVFAPGAWTEWFRFAIANAGTPSPEAVVPVPLLIRVPMALALLAWGALTDRKWTVPIAAAWASLALYEWSYLAIWVGALPLAFGPTQRIVAHTRGNTVETESPDFNAIVI